MSLSFFIHLLNFLFKHFFSLRSFLCVFFISKHISFYSLFRKRVEVRSSSHSFSQCIPFHHCPNLIIPAIVCLNGNNWTRHKTYILRRNSHNDVFFIPQDNNQCLDDIPDCLSPHQSQHIPCLVRVSTLKHII